MSAASVAILVGYALAGWITGISFVVVEVAVCVALYGFLWLAGLSYGAGEAADRTVVLSDAYRGIFQFRLVMFVFGLALSVWEDRGGMGVAAALLCGGFWLGALIESVCIGKVARAQEFSLGRALVVSLRIAGVGSRRAFRVREDA